jgi:hypothetical protein
MSQLLNQDSTLLPIPGESHTAFAIRFHEGMKSEMPRTSDRQAAMSRAWDEANPDGDDLDRYAAAECGPEKYELVRNVSYFDEHNKLHASGKTSHYGRDELASIVEKCNARIADSGNLPALTDGHTPDDMDSAKMPAVLGYAGPFRLGMVGNKRPRWAIFANEHWLTKYSHLKDERRTRSVEIECAPAIKERYFHSIAALGALAPQRDTGMVRYQLADAADRGCVEKYSSYGGAFSGMPPDQSGGTTSKSEDYAADNSNLQDGGDMTNANQQQPLSENDALQVASEVVNALMQQPWVQWAMQKAQQEQGGGTVPDDGQGDGSPASPASPAAQPQPAAAGGQSPQGQPQVDPTSGMDDDEKQIHGALPEHLKPKFAAKIGKGTAPKQPAPAAAQPQRYSADADTESDGLSHDDQNDNDAGATSQASDLDNDDSNGDETVTQPIAPEKYALLERQNKDLTDRLSKLEKKERSVERYQRLIDLKQAGDFMYDAKAEVADCDDMTDAQFEKHITKTIPEKYQRAGGNMPELFVEDSIEKRPRASSATPTVQDQAASVASRDEVVKYAMRHGLDYESARERYQAERSTKSAAAAKVV